MLNFFMLCAMRKAFNITNIAKTGSLTGDGSLYASGVPFAKMGYSNSNAAVFSVLSL